MRSYYVRALLGVLLLAVFGMQLLAPSSVASSIEALVNFEPETLNLKDNRDGLFLAFIELADPSYDVSDVDLASIALHVEGATGSIEPVRCVVASGKLVVTFYASEVAELIRATLGHMQPTPPPKAEYPRDLTVQGSVDGVDFEGSARIRVVLP